MEKAAVRTNKQAWKPTKRFLSPGYGILSRIFYKHRILLLGEYLQELIPKNENGELQIPFCTENDQLATQELFTSIVVVLPQEVPKIELGSPNGRNFLDLIRREVILPNCTEQYGKHILSLGYQRVGVLDLPPGAPVPLQQKQINTLMNFFKQDSWRLLHSRLGDQCLLFLLKQCIMFYKLANKNYLQISGTENHLTSGLIVPTVLDRNRTKSLSTEMNDFYINAKRKIENNNNKNNKLGAGYKEEITKKRNRVEEDLQPLEMMQNDGCEDSIDGLEDVRPTKKPRLSSWRRKKLKQAQNLNLKETEASMPIESPEQAPMVENEIFVHDVMDVDDAELVRNELVERIDWKSSKPVFRVIMRQYLFYYRPSTVSYGLDKDWICRRLSEEVHHEVDGLLKTIFPRVQGERFRRLENFYSILQAIIKRSKKIPYYKFLQEFCPIHPQESRFSEPAALESNLISLSTMNDLSMHLLPTALESSTGNVTQVQNTMSSSTASFSSMDRGMSQPVYDDSILPLSGTQIKTKRKFESSLALASQPLQDPRPKKFVFRTNNKQNTPKKPGYSNGILENLAITQQTRNSNISEFASQEITPFMDKTQLLCSSGMIEASGMMDEPRRVDMLPPARFAPFAEDCSQIPFFSSSGYLQSTYLSQTPTQNGLKDRSFSTQAGMESFEEHVERRGGGEEEIDVEEVLLNDLIEDIPNASMTIQTEQLLSFYSTFYEVSTYIMKILSRLIPVTAFGSFENWKILESKVSDFVRLGRFDKISTKNILDGFKLNDVNWLYKKHEVGGKEGDELKFDENGRVFLKRTMQVKKTPPEDFFYRSNIFLAFVSWLFEVVVMDIIKTTFYVTETAPHQNRVFYYRREVWVRIHEDCFLKLLEKKILEPLDVTEAKKILEKRSLGIAFLRFLPKKQGARPIVNLKRRNCNPFVEGRLNPSINTTLKAIHRVLTFETLERPDELLASSLLRNDEFYSKLAGFKSILKRVQTDNTKTGLPDLFFVKIDISQAYDTINQSKLVEMMDTVLFSLESYLGVNWSQTRVQIQKTSKFWQKKIFDPVEQPQFFQFAAKMAESTRNYIFTDGVRTETPNRDELKQLLKEHICMHIIKNGHRFYRQAQGIPQGSNLSSILCSVYYGQMEKKELPEFSTRFSETNILENQLMLRWIDDFLFITPNLEQAKAFLKKMLDGLPEYGAHVNPKKTLVNFPYTYQDNIVIPSIYPSQNSITNLGSNINSNHGDSNQGGGHQGANINNRQVGINQVGNMNGEFLWCGWYLDPKTLDVTRNHSLELYMGDSVTKSLASKPGECIFQKVFQTVQLKVHPLLFDSNLNDDMNTLYRNAYDLMRFTAMRMAALEHGAEYFRGSGVPPKPVNITFMMNTLLSVIDKLYFWINHKGNSETAKRVGFASKLDLDDITWLGLNAFHSAFAKKAGRYKELIKAIYGLLSVKRKDLGDVKLNKYRSTVANGELRFKYCIY